MNLFKKLLPLLILPIFFVALIFSAKQTFAAVACTSNAECGPNQACNSQGQCFDKPSDTTNAQKVALPLPKFSKPSGTYTSSIKVSISDALAGTTIRYTTDGSTPDTNSKTYSGAITVTKDMTVKAKAFKTGFAHSDVATATYKIKSGGGGGGGNTCDKGYKIELTSPSGGDGQGKAGDAVKYAVKISNNDSSACPNSDTFTLTKSIANNPNGKWDGKFDNKSLTIKAGQTGTANLTVTSPAGAQKGDSHTITITAQGTRTNSPHGEKSVNGTYTVKGDNGGGGGGGGGNGKNGKLIIFVGIDGIGSTPRVPHVTRTQNGHTVELGGNLNPVQGFKSRTLTVDLYKGSSKTITKAFTQSFDYVPAQRRYKAEIDLPDNFTTGDYSVYVKGNPYETSVYPGAATITAGKDKTTTLNSDKFYLITGNLNDNNTSANRVDILDFNIVNSCWIYSADQTLCNSKPAYKTNADLNADGKVDYDDMTLLISEWVNQQGAIEPGQ